MAASATFREARRRTPPSRADQPDPATVRAGQGGHGGVALTSDPAPYEWTPALTTADRGSLPTGNGMPMNLRCGYSFFGRVCLPGRSPPALTAIRRWHHRLDGYVGPGRPIGGTFGRQDEHGSIIVPCPVRPGGTTVAR